MSLCAEGQAFCSPVTDLLALLVVKYPLPGSRPLSGAEWKSRLDSLFLELASPTHESGESLSLGSSERNLEWSPQAVHELREIHLIFHTQ